MDHLKYPKHFSQRRKKYIRVKNIEREKFHIRNERINYRWDDTIKKDLGFSFKYIVN